MSPNRNNSEKNKARRAVRAAEIAGLILCPEICPSCGRNPGRAKDGRRLLEAHHHAGYDRPLEIQWLCSVCHKREHPNRGALNGNAKLTPEMVALVRRSGEGSLRLAKLINIDASTIRKIRRGEIWRDAHLNLTKPEEGK